MLGQIRHILRRSAENLLLQQRFLLYE